MLGWLIVLVLSVGFACVFATGGGSWVKLDPDEAKLTWPEYLLRRRTIVAFIAGIVMLLYMSNSATYLSDTGKVKANILTVIWYILSWMLLMYFKFGLSSHPSLEEMRFVEGAELLTAVIMAVLFGWVAIPYVLSAELEELSKALGEARGWTTVRRSYGPQVPVYRMVPYWKACTFGVTFFMVTLWARQGRNKKWY